MNNWKVFFGGWLLLLLATNSCHTEQTISVEIDVVLHTKDERHTSPLTVTIENRTRGAGNYLWTFEGGVPQTSTQKDPGMVRFVDPGEHAVTLEAWNDGDRTSQTYTVRVDSAVTVDFIAEADVNNYAPASFLITNRSSGGSFYRWTFEGGVPASYDGHTPPTVIFIDKGTYAVTLETGNGSEQFLLSRQIEVREPLGASFSIVPSFEDEDDREAPLLASFITQLQGVETLRWTCDDAEIAGQNSADATIRFPEAGDYTVYLEVSNNKNQMRISQEITVKPNTNLRTHRNIRLGINTATANCPVYYSTKLRRTFHIPEINDKNGLHIDIVFFGLSRNFTYNRFVSPDQLSQTTFPEIPGALPVSFINKIESTNLTLTPAQFNNMNTDALLRGLPVAAMSTPDSDEDFFTNAPLPRIVLLETADGRKGAILVKKMLAADNEDSYVEVDIKIQKND